MDLRPGRNLLLFRAPHNRNVVCCLYLWDADDNVIISDIDGTITKSDVLGHVMFFMGRDWTHKGVAELFTKVAQNGYRVLYLTSRAVGQTAPTKQYLSNIRQRPTDGREAPMPGVRPRSASRSMPGLEAEAEAPTLLLDGATIVAGGWDLEEIERRHKAEAMATGAGAEAGAAAPVGGSAEAGAGGAAAQDGTPGGEAAGWFRLPPGPVITSSDRLLKAFTREVILRRPEEFKKRALGEVQEVFSRRPAGPAFPTPFTAGFGNRMTDVVAYRHVGIDDSRIFVINPDSVVQPMHSLTYKTSYRKLAGMADQLFPAVFRGTAGAATTTVAAVPAPGAAAPAEGGASESAGPVADATGSQSSAGASRTPATRAVAARFNAHNYYQLPTMSLEQALGKKTQKHPAAGAAASGGSLGAGARALPPSLRGML